MNTTLKALTLLLGFGLLMASFGCSKGDDPKVEMSKDGMTVEGKDVSASLGGGTVVSEEEVRMPFYPGSSPKPNSDVKIEAASEKNYMSVRTTADTPEKVAEFYESKVKGLKFNRFASGDTTNVMASTEADGWKIAVTASKKGATAQTEITLAAGMETKK